jgi:hypothetical protein
MTALSFSRDSSRAQWLWYGAPEAIGTTVLTRAHELLAGVKLAM